jgi:hypothetical protein
MWMEPIIVQVRHEQGRPTIVDESGRLESCYGSEGRARWEGDWRSITVTHHGDALVAPTSSGAGRDAERTIFASKCSLRLRDFRQRCADNFVHGPYLSWPKGRDLPTYDA